MLWNCVSFSSKIFLLSVFPLWEFVTGSSRRLAVGRGNKTRWNSENDLDYWTDGDKNRLCLKALFIYCIVFTVNIHQIPPISHYLTYLCFHNESNLIILENVFGDDPICTLAQRKHASCHRTLKLILENDSDWQMKSITQNASGCRGSLNELIRNEDAANNRSEDSQDWIYWYTQGHNARQNIATLRKFNLLPQTKCRFTTVINKYFVMCLT